MEVSNAYCGAMHHPVLPPVSSYIGMYQKSSTIQIRHIVSQSLYNMSESFHLLSAFVSVVDVALTALSPPSFDIQLEHLQLADQLQLLEF